MRAFSVAPSGRRRWGVGRNYCHPPFSSLSHPRPVPQTWRCRDGHSHFRQSFRQCRVTAEASTPTSFSCTLALALQAQGPMF